MPDSVATILREAREEQNLSLREVAAVLNIRYVYLQAIEDGEFGKLPGTTYAIGFLRSYADHLALDGDDLVNRFKAEAAGLSTQTQLVFPTPVPEGKVPGGALILVSVLFLALAYGAWSYFSGQDEQIADAVPVVPERLQDLLDAEPPSTGVVPAYPVPGASADDPAGGSAAPAESQAAAGASLEAAWEEAAGEGAAGGDAVSSPSTEASPSSLETTPFETAPIGTEATAAAPVESQATPSARSDQSAVATGSNSAPATPPAAASPEPAADTAEQMAVTSALATPAPQAIPTAPSTDEIAAVHRPLEAQVYGRGNLDARIVLRATQDAWVQVRDNNEDLLFTRVLRAGDSYRVPNQAGLTLLTGNAGGLDVEVDGKDLGPLGPVGSVRRNVILEPDKLREGSSRGP